MNKILLVLIMKYSYLTFSWHRLRFHFWCLELCFESSKDFKPVECSGWIYLYYFFFFWVHESGILELEIYPGSICGSVCPLKFFSSPYCSSPPKYTLLNSWPKFLQDNLLGRNSGYWAFVDSLNNLEYSHWIIYNGKNNIAFNDDKMLNCYI